MKLLNLFRRKSAIPLDKNKIIGVTLGWDLNPHICHADGTYYPTSIERRIYADYFKHGDWPYDPVTGEKLPIAT